MSGSIILDPKLMFQTLHDLEDETIDILVTLTFISEILQDVSNKTYAHGFSALIKKAERDINHGGHAAVAANNGFNTACKEVINKLVTKFASQGAKSHYNGPQFETIHFKVNVADRAEINPQAMRSLFVDLATLTNKLNTKFDKMQETYEHTKAFWVGASAEKARHNFKSKVVPLFNDLEFVLDDIFFQGIDWVNQNVKFEEALPTP